MKHTKTESTGSARISLTIPCATKERLEQAIPSRQRSAFAAKAIEDALKAEAQSSFLETIRTMKRYPTHGESSVEVLRKHREQFDQIDGDY